MRMQTHFTRLFQTVVFTHLCKLKLVIHQATDQRACIAVESFVDTDQKYLQADSGANRDDGCTAVTAILVGQNLVVANVGDSRAVLSKGGQGEDLVLP